MASLVVDLFAEDSGHEELLKAFVRRLSQDAGRKATVHVRSSRGGHGKAVSEFEAYQKRVVSGAVDLADIVVVAIDSNCTPINEAVAAIEGSVDDKLVSRVVVACPDPHVERWYMADLDSFEQIIGHRPSVSTQKCERGYYKQALRTAITKAGHPVLLGGIEFAPELVDAMDLYKAGKAVPSLGRFLDALRRALRQLG